MRVVAPLTQLHPHAFGALATYAPHAAFVDVSSDDECYWRLLRGLWGLGESLAIVEHDIEVHSGTLSSFEACVEPWCVAPYTGMPYKRYPVPVLRCALGCVRFSAGLIAATPTLIDDLPVRHWRRLDSQIATFLQRAGYRAHEHEPHVVHHHDYSA